MSDSPAGVLAFRPSPLTAPHPETALVPGNAGAGAAARPAPAGTAPEGGPDAPLSTRARGWARIALLTYLLISAVGVIGAGFSTAVGGQAEELFAFATNPFIGLLVGLLATVLMQSSSTTTSIIVGMVAGGLPIGIAIPMVMGANIGTTVTNTLASFGHVGDRQEFRRAFSAATIHDWFNLLAVAIFLPLEVATGFLERTSGALSAALSGGDGYDASGLDVVGAATAPVTSTLEWTVSAIPEAVGGVVLIVVGIAGIFLAVRFLGKVLQQMMVGRARRVLHASIGRGPLTGIGAGAGVTVLVQSSSVTTSLMIPLAGAGTFSLRRIYPFMLGANIGTTVTALLAATAVTGELGPVALQIALVHLLFNVAGVAVIYGLPFLRNIPLTAADRLADLAARRKSVAVAWVTGVFLVLPGALVMLPVIV